MISLRWDEGLLAISHGDVGCDPSAAMHRLIDALRLERARRSHEEWKCFVEAARASPVCRLLHLDPFTLHSFTKPRGYPGDAALLDLIYYQRPPEGTSAFAAKLFAWTSGSPAPTAVRNRRRIIADLLDEHCGERDGARILSLACGHLREAELSCAIQDRRFAHFTAFDQDPLSLTEVSHRYGSRGIGTVQGSVRDILTGQTVLDEYSFIYTLGLYDYFSDRLATRMTTLLFERIEPGGRLLIANFVPDIRDVGYMECFMDWWLIYRTGEDMLRLLEEIPPECIASHRVLFDDSRQIVLLEVRRR